MKNVINPEFNKKKKNLKEGQKESLKQKKFGHNLYPSLPVYGEQSGCVFSFFMLFYTLDRPWGGILSAISTGQITTESKWIFSLLYNGSLGLLFCCFFSCIYSFSQLSFRQSHDSDVNNESEINLWMLFQWPFPEILTSNVFQQFPSSSRTCLTSYSSHTMTEPGPTPPASSGIRCAHICM